MAEVGEGPASSPWNTCIVWRGVKLSSTSLQGPRVLQTAPTSHMYTTLKSSHRRHALDAAYVCIGQRWQNRKGQSSRPVHWLRKLQPEVHGQMGAACSLTELCTQQHLLHLGLYVFHDNSSVQMWLQCTWYAILCTQKAVLVLLNSPLG